MKYTLVYDSVPELLIDKVNRLIQQGWEPMGGLAVSRHETEEVFYQAMMKKEKIGKKKASA